MNHLAVDKHDWDGPKDGLNTRRVSCRPVLSSGANPHDRGSCQNQGHFPRSKQGLVFRLGASKKTNEFAFAYMVSPLKATKSGVPLKRQNRSVSPLASQIPTRIKVQGLQGSPKNHTQSLLGHPQIPHLIQGTPQQPPR